MSRSSKMDFPPLAWPAELHEDHFMLLDESQLPDKVTYIRIENYQEAVGAIREMKTRAFGQLLTVFYALILTVRRAGSDASLKNETDAACSALNASRPTFAFSRYTDMVRIWTEAAVKQGAGDPAENISGKILKLLEKIKGMRLQRAKLAATLIKDGDRILTHCNTSGELLLTARFCRDQGKRLHFFATETRPYFQGRLTAWELGSEGFDVMLIPDNRAAQIISSGECTKIITGADRVALNGDIVNKTGSSQLAVLAHYFNIPFYAYVQEPGNTQTGKDIDIEHRGSGEVTRFRGKDVYPTGTEAFYPAFDITPHEYITALITFEKILTPADLPAGWRVS